VKIHSVYDYGGETLDRYTVYYKGRGSLERPQIVNGQVVRWRTGRGMSERPFHPQGFGMCISGNPGRHNGKRIQFRDLPEDCQRLVAQDLETTVEALLEQNKPKEKHGQDSD